MKGKKLASFLFSVIILQMLKKRRIKQLIYGGGYLAVIFLILFSVYSIWLKSAPTCSDNRKNQKETGVDCGGSCNNCEIKTLSPIAVDWVKYFSADSKIVIAAEIKNSNSNYGAKKFSYAFDIYDKKGEKIKTLIRSSFIYPEEIKYLVEFLEINPKEIGNVQISFADFNDFNWAPKEDFSKPEIESREITVKINSIDNKIEIKGIANNKSAFSLSKIKIIAFLKTADNMFISVSQTELENLAAFDKRPFAISFPKGIGLTSATSSVFLADPNKTKIYIEAAR